MNFKNLDIKNLAKRLLLYIGGLYILALGVAFSVISNLGVSPVSSVPYVLSVITDMDFGMMCTIFFTSCMLIQIIMLRKKYKIINLLQIICSFIFGSFVTLASLSTAWINIGNNYFMQMFMCVLGIIFVAIGVYLYLKASFMSIPCEGVMEAMVVVFKMNLHNAKIIYDCSSVLLAVVLSFVFLNGEIVGVREGTVICAVGVGLCMKVIHKLLDKKVEKFLK